MVKFFGPKGSKYLLKNPSMTCIPQKGLFFAWGTRQLVGGILWFPTGQPRFDSWGAQVIFSLIKIQVVSGPTCFLFNMKVLPSMSETDYECTFTHMMSGLQKKQVQLLNISRRTLVYTLSHPENDRDVTAYSRQRWRNLCVFSRVQKGTPD